MIQNTVNISEDLNISDTYQTSSNLLVVNIEVTKDKNSLDIFERKVLRKIYSPCKDVNKGGE